MTVKVILINHSKDEKVTREQEGRIIKGVNTNILS